jgi:hypothetical protein
MSVSKELSNYLQEKYVTDHNKHYKCQYHVGKEKHQITIFTNRAGAIEHCDNLGLTLIEAD